MKCRNKKQKEPQQQQQQREKQLASRFKVALSSKQQQFFIKMKIAANCQAMCVIKGRGGGGKWLEALSGGRTDCVDLAPGSLKCQLHCKLWS